MRVLLTGASGFVGHHTAWALSAAGHDLRLLARPSSDLSPFAELPHERVDAALDDADPAAFAAAFSAVSSGPAGADAAAPDSGGIEAVVHVAGLTVASRARDFDRVNALGTAGLARAAAEAGVSRFLYISSLAAQGPSRDGVPAHPDAPCKPITDYGRSKAAGEEAVLRTAGPQAGGMRVQILRPPAVYGPRDVALLPFFRMARRRFVTRVGDGRSRVSVIYGPDLGDAIAALLAQPLVQADAQPEAPPQSPPRSPPEGRPRIFHISDADGPYDWRTLIETLAAVFGHRLVTVPVPAAGFAALARVGVAVARLRGARPLLDPSRVQEMRQDAWLSDNAVLTAATGWTPSTPLDQGLAETLRWYREQGWV